VDAVIKKGFQTQVEIQQFQEMIKRGASIVTYLTTPMNIPIPLTAPLPTPTPLPTPVTTPPVQTTAPVQRPEILLKPTDPRSPADLKKSSIPLDKRKINNKLIPEVPVKRKETAGVKRPAQLISKAEPEEEQETKESKISNPVPQNKPSEKTGDKLIPVSKTEAPVLTPVASAPLRTENRTCRQEVPTTSIQQPVKMDTSQQTGFFTGPPRPPIVTTIPGLQQSKHLVLPVLEIDHPVLQIIAKMEDKVVSRWFLHTLNNQDNSESFKGT